MRRRSRAGGKPIAARRRKATTLSRSNAPKVRGRRNPASTNADTKIALLTRERDEALEQFSAASEILKVISSSPGDLKPVFEAILEKATRICEAKFGVLTLREADNSFRVVAMHNAPSAYVEFRRRDPFLKLAPNTALMRALTTKRAAQIADVIDHRATQDDPQRRSFVALTGARTLIVVPTLKENEIVGAMIIYRQEVRSFTNQQIELLENFSAQAVIAIENTRLLNELRDSLEQQTATSEVLSVISSSPGELEPVFKAVLEKATRICEANFGVLFRLDDGVVHVGATLGVPPALEKFMQSVRRPGPHSATARAMRTGQVIHILDVREERGYREGDPMLVFGADKVGLRTLVAAPMLKDKVPIGSIGVYRTEVRPFTDKQIELLRNFAAQAVIAIENTRLLNELRQRTADLTESLEQQTATSEVLKVISSSPGNLEAVFQAMLENAIRICDARFGTLLRFDGNAFHLAAGAGLPPKLAEFHRQHEAFQPVPGSPLDRAMQTKRVSHTVDDAAETLPSPPAQLAGARSMVCVPMLKDNTLTGAIVIYRQEVQPFTDNQIELLENFAAQAVIAIENTRLLNELRQRTDDLTESLEQQTATSEVLSVISSSPGDLEPVFQSMLRNATRICEAKSGFLFRAENDGFRIVASSHGQVGFIEQMKHQALKLGPLTPIGRAALTRQIVHVPNLSEDQAYLEREPLAVWAVEQSKVRTLLAVPMIREEELIGVFGIEREEVKPFTDKQIALVQNFAAQAIIAIENTRLLSELRESLERQTATSEVLKVISSSPGELGPVFEAMLANAVRLCGSSYGALWLSESDAFRTAAFFGDLPPPYTEAWRIGTLFRPPPEVPISIVARTHKPAQIADLRDTSGYRDGFPLFRTAVDDAGILAVLAVPMLKDDELVGAIVIYRKEPVGFTEKQVELVSSFAAQAVIAIENTRLLNELRQSLEQQTATSEVLSVISSSPGDLKPVFETLLANAVRICGAKFGMLFLPEGDDAYRIVALHGAPPAFAESRRREPVIRLNPATTLGRVAATKQIVQVEDIRADPAYTRDPTRSALLDLSGARTMLNVPMLKDDELVGQIAIYRQEVRPFTEKQIALVQNFAAQAVIAIENTRLLSELRQSLQQQTATADVLKVISRSTFDLQTVLDTLVESAARLCEADMAATLRQKGSNYVYAASYGFPPELQEQWKVIELTRGRGSVTGRAVLEGKVVHVHDIRADSEYTLTAVKEQQGARTILGVPLLREGVSIGVFVLIRHTVRPFTNKQIELVSTFADQAVIAIENVRLFDEIQDKSRQLEVASQHKSQFLANMSHELRTPLNAILGYTELMADGIYGELPEKTMGVLKRLESNGRHLLGLINDVLDLSKIEAGQLVLELTEYSLEDIAQTVRSTLEPLAADKKLTFKVDVSPKLPAGHGDGRRLTQVLINLVGNAIKFTDTGEVVIKASATDGSFHLSVQDTGPGISAVDQAKLFQEFQQADNAITRKKGGTGLGLAISKRIVEMHGGRVWLESQVGRGSTFSFTIPVRVERQVETA
jgi:GAF domain-containing protein